MIRGGVQVPYHTYLVIVALGEFRLITAEPVGHTELCEGAFPVGQLEGSSCNPPALGKAFQREFGRGHLFCSFAATWQNFSGELLASLDDFYSLLIFMGTGFY